MEQHVRNAPPLHRPLLRNEDRGSGTRMIFQISRRAIPIAWCWPSSASYIDKICLIMYKSYFFFCTIYWSQLALRLAYLVLPLPDRDRPGRRSWFTFTVFLDCMVLNCFSFSQVSIFWNIPLTSTKKIHIFFWASQYLFCLRIYDTYAPWLKTAAYFPLLYQIGNEECERKKWQRTKRRWHKCATYEISPRLPDLSFLA